MSVVGIDFGNLSLLIAQCSKGGVDVILNSASNRQTATAVSIMGRQRFIGDEGAAMVSHFCASGGGQRVAEVPVAPSSGTRVQNVRNFSSALISPFPPPPSTTTTPQ